MAKSTDESRSLVNQAVRKTLKVGESVHATSLRELAQALGLDPNDPNARVVGTLKSMKFNRTYRRAVRLSTSGSATRSRAFRAKTSSSLGELNKWVRRTCFTKASLCEPGWR